MKKTLFLARSRNLKKVTALVIFAVMTAALGFGQTSADEWFKKAGEYFESGDYANAVKAYSETIKRDGSNLNAYWVRGLAYFLIKNYDAAIADFATVIQRAPDLPDAYVTRGDAYGAKGLYHKAAADYRTGFEKGYEPSGFVVDKSSKADMWFCGTMYMEITANRFLGNSAVVTKYENWLKTVCDNNKVTRAEVETFYRQNIGALVAAAVDAEFNKTIFLMDRRYNAVLIRDFKTGSYALSYEGYFSGIEQTKQITASSLNALLAEMKSGANKADFDQNCIDQVAAENANIPAIFLGKLGKDPQAALTDIITAFYLNPTNQTVYGAMRDVNVFYDVVAGVSDNPTNREMYETIGAAYINTLTALSPELKQRVINDSRGRTSTALPSEVRNRLQLK